MGVLLKVGIGINLADVGGNVEEEREPSNPSEELNGADLLDLGRQFLD